MRVELICIQIPHDNKITTCQWNIHSIQKKMNTWWLFLVEISQLDSQSATHYWHNRGSLYGRTLGESYFLSYLKIVQLVILLFTSAHICISYQNKDDIQIFTALIILWGIEGLLTKRRRVTATLGSGIM